MKTLKHTDFSIKPEPKTREWLLLGIGIILASLFAYTGITKIMDHERFMNGISKVGLIGQYSFFISWFVPVTEILIAVLLLIPQFIRIGLWSFLLFMLAFTSYILIALIWASNLPCHCGGVVESLTWTQHLWLNLGFIFLSIVAIRLEKRVNP
ncbi:DoxX family protein [Pedobacter aquatilis]|uniref:MauE/DoxX family redox-associated membrane protein n=1 Tax=Pedobacter aquatilis TaxID=351343 RepID=UPI0025B54BC1|nr:DoxX family protein [Pedobacter aquatilis]MDN3588052.1 DoxX family protein [Pedobacter aquatilis]